ncbi:MAG: tRNA dihydrouridine synthase DusB [archaeon]
MFPRTRSRLLLAPMAGYTDPAFRELATLEGAGMVYTELISADAVIHSSDKTIRMLQVNEAQMPCGVQLFGDDPGRLAKAASMLEKDFSLIDLNCGCPARKVTQAGFGSALLKDPEKICDIIREVKKAIKIPVTIKIRAGINEKNVNAHRIARLAEEAGADAVAVHARTKAQGFSGSADWELIKEIKKELSIPVIGNGGIDRPEDASRMLESTGCDYAMVGRAALGNPLFFSRFLEMENGDGYDPITAGERIGMLRNYITLAEKYSIPFFSIKSQALKFLVGFGGSRSLRDSVAKASTVKQVQQII